MIAGTCRCNACSYTHSKSQRAPKMVGVVKKQGCTLDRMGVTNKVGNLPTPLFGSSPVEAEKRKRYDPLCYVRGIPSRNVFLQNTLL